MRVTTYSILFVALLSSGCTNAAFHDSVKTYAGTAFDELRVSPGSEFVRANAKDDNSPNTSFVSSELSLVGDEHFVNYYPIRVSDLRRFAPIKPSDAVLADGPSEWSRAYADEQRPRSLLIPTQWNENAIRRIPTRWDARVVLTGQDECQLPGPPTEKRKSAGDQLRHAR